MNNVIEFIQNSISVFDLLVVLIVIYSMARCAAKGFTLSLLSFSKWLVSLVITIILVPKFNPWVQNYIESKFVADIGLGIFIFIISLFIRDLFFTIFKSLDLIISDFLFLSETINKFFILVVPSARLELALPKGQGF